MGPIAQATAKHAKAVLAMPLMNKEKKEDDA